LYGKDTDKLREVSQKVRTAFQNTHDMVDVNDTEPFDIEESHVIVDKEKAALSGISNADVAQILHVLFAGGAVGRVHPPGEKNSVPIRVRVPYRYQLDPGQLNRVLVENAAGKRVPLSELVRVMPGRQDRPILHKDNERVSFVGGELTKTAPVYAVLDLDKRLDGMDIGNGVRLETRNLTFRRVVPDTIGNYQLLWDGEIRLTLDTFRDMGMALGLALVLVFLLLVGYYRSFSIPVIAMLTIPFGMIGVFPGHWIMGADFSATSMVGIIALAGVAIRSALLIIDFIRDNQEHGMSLTEAVYRAGTARTLPILLTTLAVILGSAVMLTDPVFSGLAISLIFGTAASSILTILLIPILYQRLAVWRAGRGRAAVALLPATEGTNAVDQKHLSS
ncbi:MAG: efflux RND transporter permease subunit, partial [Hyphomicrobium sp.]